jgi:hypothetical protein
LPDLVRGRGGVLCPRIVLLVVAATLHLEDRAALNHAAPAY